MVACFALMSSIDTAWLDEWCLLDFVVTFRPRNSNLHFWNWKGYCDWAGCEVVARVGCWLVDGCVGDCRPLCALADAVGGNTRTELLDFGVWHDHRVLAATADDESRAHLLHYCCCHSHVVHHWYTGYRPGPRTHRARNSLIRDLIGIPYGWVLPLPDSQSNFRQNDQPVGFACWYAYRWLTTEIWSGRLTWRSRWDCISFDGRARRGRFYIKPLTSTYRAHFNKKLL